MEALPTELLSLILLWDIRMCRCEKNSILPLRLVCKAFDTLLRPYVFKTIQLEFSRFLRQRRGAIGAREWEEEGYDAKFGEDSGSGSELVKGLEGHGGGSDGMWGSERGAVWKLHMDREGLRRVGGYCEALYLDLMVVRDEEEISRLSNVFQGLIPKVPEMVPLLASLRRYCMNDTTFDGTDFSEVLESVLDATPNLERLKLNLPFQVVGQHSRTATLLLAITMSALTRRPEEAKVLNTLVLDHVSDTTLIDICNNPVDLSNTIKSFSGLKHLVLSIKRQESRDSRQASFAIYLWFLIRKAVSLESLCLIGWNIKRDITSRIHLHGVLANVWNMRSLPFHLTESRGLSCLRYLELKRVDIDARSLINLLTETASTLEELYLNEVYLKVQNNFLGGALATVQVHNDLWIGLGGNPTGEIVWVAEAMRDIKGLDLDILRATGLGYDVFNPEISIHYPHYDLRDPFVDNRSFDQRFVETALGLGPTDPDHEMDPDAPGDPQAYGPPDPLPTFESLTAGLDAAAAARIIETGMPDALLENQNRHRNPKEYDAETFQRSHNTTSHYKRCIDGLFFNHNEQALKELQNIITVADRGMTLLSEEIDRARYGTGVLDELL